MRAARTLLSRWAQGAAPTGVRGHPDVSGGRRTAPPRHLVRRLRRRRRPLGEPGAQGLRGRRAAGTLYSLLGFTYNCKIKSKIRESRTAAGRSDGARVRVRDAEVLAPRARAARDGRWPARPWGRGGPRAGGNALSFPLTPPWEAPGAHGGPLSIFHDIK